MKLALKISLGLNLALLGGLTFALVKHRETATVPALGLSAGKPTVDSPAVPVATSPSEPLAQPFRWSDLDSSKGYQGFIANLRAIGCPETSIADIVQGNVDRAFRWERNQLGLDGSGDGPWSQSRENEMIANLLGEPPAQPANALVQDTGNPTQENNAGGSDEIASSEGAVSKTPLFLQDVNWSALGFDSSEQSAINRVRQQFQYALNIQNQTSSDSAAQNSSQTADQNSSGPSDVNPNLAGQTSGDATSGEPMQTALQNADDQLRNALGYQGYAAYEQEQYLKWYTPQVTAAGSGPLTLNLPAFSPE